MPRLAILADDLTGAADTGAPFARAGLVTSIVLAGDPALDLDVIVRSTNSRDIDASTAMANNTHAVRELAGLPEPHRPRWVYKKIDSALRGHPRDELLAAMAVMGETRALIAPALPAEARTTIGGRHLIDGSPLERTSLGSPGVPSDLAVLFGRGGGIPVHRLDLDTIRRGEAQIARVLHRFTSGLLVADAETDRDLLAIARAALNSDLRAIAGSAGLARQIARILSSDRGRSGVTSPEPVAGPVLIVAGSQHAATARQVQTLEREGYPVVRPSQSLLDDHQSSPDTAISDLVTHLSGGRSVVLTTAGLAPSPLGPAFVVSRLTDIVASSRVQSQVGGLVLTGGDVAAAILTRMGASELRLVGEVRPAMPWALATVPPATTIPVATKAGSFGSDDALLACVHRLTRHPANAKVDRR